jgi:cobalt-precorrin 5A hydrolase/precorrin-3B C17-methyltransferase
MAREIAEALGVAAAITTSGELRFGTCLLNPPQGYALADLEQGKRFVSDLLAGEPVRIEGAAPWLQQAQLPASETAQRTIHVGIRRARPTDELLIHPRRGGGVAGGNLRGMRAALQQAGIAEPSVACLLAASTPWPTAFARGCAGLGRACALPAARRWPACRGVARCRLISMGLVAVAPAPVDVAHSAAVAVAWR